MSSTLLRSTNAVGSDHSQSNFLVVAAEPMSDNSTPSLSFIVKFNSQPHFSEGSIERYPCLTQALANNYPGLSVVDTASFPPSNHQSMSSSFTAPFSTPSCSIFPLAHDSPPLESDRRPDSEGPTYPPFMFVNSWSDELAAVACLAHLTAQNFIPILNEPRDDLPVWSGEGLPSSGLLSQVTAPSTQRSRTIVFHSDMERTDFSGDSNHPSSHGGTKHTCNICGKDFQRPCSLETHMNMHYGRKPFICIVPECRKAFSVKSNALRHMRMHGPSMGYPSIAEHAAAPYVVNFAPIETAASYSIPALAESITDSAISL